MTQKERMKLGMIYNPNDPVITKEQMPYLDKLFEFNNYKPSEVEKKNKYMKEVFASCGENCYITPPFHANWGGHHIHFGNNVYANFNFTCVDDGEIFVGNNVMFGPNVTIATAGHPIEPSLREKALQYNKDVHIEDNVWIGANVVVLPGVTIGKNSVIGAGSIVTKSIPNDVIAVGNPCRVLREISDHDREFFYKEEKIDWEACQKLIQTPEAFYQKLQKEEFKCLTKEKLILKALEYSNLLNSYYQKNGITRAKANELVKMEFAMAAGSDGKASKENHALYKRIFGNCTFDAFFKTMSTYYTTANVNLIKKRFMESKDTEYQKLFLYFAIAIIDCDKVIESDEEKLILTLCEKYLNS